MIKSSNSWQWDICIVGETANNFRKGYESNNCDLCIKHSVALLEELYSHYYILDKRHSRRITNLIQKFNVVEKDFDSINKLLDKLYDMCDEYRVFIGL